MQLDNVMPVLRTPAAAIAAPDLLHVAPPAEREDDTPLVAFTSDGYLVRRSEARGFEDALYRAALANLAKRRGSWRVEKVASGIAGFGRKSTALMSLEHDFAAEHILLDGFLDDVERMVPAATFFIPRRGVLRCAAPAYVDKERSKARRAFVTAGPEAVCPCELHRSPVVGQTFVLGAKYCDVIYATPGPQRAIT